MGKPVGVILIAILEFLGAAGYGLVGLLMIAGGGIMAAAMSQQQAQGAGGLATLMGALGAAAGAVFLILAVLCIVLGVGLLKLKNWARLITVVFCCIGFAFQLFGLYGVFTHFNPVSLISALIVLGINGLIIWYLMRADIKAAFMGMQARAATA